MQQHLTLPLVDDLQRGHQFEKYDQYATPEWIAEMITERFCDGMPDGACIADLGCGRGPFLKYIPSRIRAIGIEIDPAMASYAELNTGRPVVVGDFATAVLPFRPDAFIANPPFTKKTVDQWLDLIHGYLPEGGRAGMLLPAYHFQWSRPVMEWHKKFSIEQTMIPREIFPGLMKPINWVVFTKERVRRMIGFFLYPEVADVKEFNDEAKRELIHGKPKRSAWRAVVEAALSKFGGKASLSEIYEFVGDKRPTENRWWKEQVRKVLQGGSFARAEEGVYQLAA